jgi:hypothetical protein
MHIVWLQGSYSSAVWSRRINGFGNISDEYTMPNSVS